MFSYNLCEECNQKNAGHEWCNSCKAKHFQRNFKNWTSGNDDIDKLIQGAQLSAKNRGKVLEWIPYDRFYNIEYIAKGGFGKVYRANWIDGRIIDWNNKNQNWDRYGSQVVALKSLNNSKNATLEFLNEITMHHRVTYDVYSDYSNITEIYGISQDPETKNYVMVLDYAEHGSLRNYLDTNYNKFSWRDKLFSLFNIAVGLNGIHDNKLIHRDLHVGNILSFNEVAAFITDMGLCRPADYNELKNTKSNIYGVLPYIAPEILRGQNYTKAADVYSFGIIIYEVISGLPPYHDVSHDESLAIKICLGLRPRFNIKVPQLIVRLIKRCLDANPLNRPTIEEIENLLFDWWDGSDKELNKQIEEAEEINNNLSTNSVISSTSLALSYETHSEAIYTSRLLNFNDLPEPKNSDDYYEQYNNIISEKYSDSLQIDISQLKINNDAK